MRKQHPKKKRRAPPKAVLRLPDLDQPKSAVLNSLTSADAQRGYRHAIDEFVEWYCSEPRLSFNRTVVLRYRIHLESRKLAARTVNLRLGAVRRLAYEASDCGLLSGDLAAGTRRVKGVKKIGVRLGNWLLPEQAMALLDAPDPENYIWPAQAIYAAGESSFRVADDSGTTQDQRSSALGPLLNARRCANNHRDMNIEQAAAYWESRLKEGRPIYRVRVRRLLELAGSERRGYVIVQKIRKVLDAHGLVTIPDFELAWIDSLVRIRLAPNGDAQESLEPSLDRVVKEQVSSDNSIVDPAFSDQNQSPLAAEAVAEPLNAPLETTTPEATDAAVTFSVDPIVRVASLAAANRGVVSVSVNDKLDKATTLMLFENYSQLAVMQGARDVKGMISWESIARRSMQSPLPSTVLDCMIEARIVNATDALFKILPEVEQYGYVLVRDNGKITGIVTATDFATELASMSQAFASIGTIERLIRNRLHPCLKEEDLSHLEQHSRALAEKDFGRLTFGENVRLMERPQIWSRLKVSVDKAEFTRRLSLIGEIRNDVMHFNPDPPSASQKRGLEQMESFLRHVFH